MQVSNENLFALGGFLVCYVKWEMFMKFVFTINCFITRTRTQSFSTCCIAYCHLYIWPIVATNSDHISNYFVNVRPALVEMHLVDKNYKLLKLYHIKMCFCSLACSVLLVGIHGVGKTFPILHPKVCFELLPVYMPVVFWVAFVIGVCTLSWSVCFLSS